jgi:hypothetical protein
MIKNTTPSNCSITSSHFTLVYLPIAAIIVAIGYYFAFLYQHAINVPLADDIFDVLQVITALSQAESVTSSLDIIYAQHNEHRTLASRLVYYGVFNLFGEINFRTLIFIANLSLPILFGLLLFRVRRHSLRYLLALPAALIIFQLRAHGVMLWSMAAFAYFYVFLYGFFTLFSLHEVTPLKFTVAATTATLGTFTLASGQLIWLLGLASLAQQALICKTAPYRYIGLWIATATCAICAWRFDLDSPVNPIDMLRNFLSIPGHHVLYALTLLGSAISGTSIAYASIAGTILLCVLVIATIRGYRNKDLRLEFCCWLIVLTVLTMVLGRAPYSAIEYALVSRYSFPSILLLATLWVLIAARIDASQAWKLSRPIFLSASLIAGIYCISSYHVYAMPLQQHVEQRVKNFNREKYVVWMHPLDTTNEIVAQAIAQGVYNPPPRPLAKPNIARIK